MPLPSLVRIRRRKSSKHLPERTPDRPLPLQNSDVLDSFAKDLPSQRHEMIVKAVGRH